MNRTATAMAAEPSAAPSLTEGRWAGFQDLGQHRVHDVLLVASPYESYILAEDGQPHAALLSEFVDLNIHHIPRFRHVSTGAEALALVREPRRPDMVIASLHVGDMNAAQLARRLWDADLRVPFVVLAYDAQVLADFRRRDDMTRVDRVFLWQGDANIFLAIVKLVEDRLNVAHDTGRMGVQAVLVVEDSVKYYSSFLPAIYAEVIGHSRRLVPEGLNLAHQLLRFQARPKILLSTSFEEAAHDFSDYQENVLGVISDVEFPREGKVTRDAGVELARMVRAVQPDVPIILQSRSPESRADALAAGASFLLKGSPFLLQELRRLMTEYFSFGDFVFRLPDGAEVGRASDLRSLEERLRTVPAESIAYHGERHHFSKWLKARTEFAVAQRLRPRQVSDFATIEDLRRELIQAIQEYRRERSRVTVSDFRAATYDPAVSFARLGTGSLGGKARGLAFVNLRLHEHGVRDRFPGTRVVVPPALVLATDVFDEFLERNRLRDFVLSSPDDVEVRRRVLEGQFPSAVERDLGAFLELVREPLAVRSSSLLEDSPYQPFAGVYDTRMIGNDQPGLASRLGELLYAVKLVYASTFGRRAKAYLEAIGSRLEEERMAVILQRVVGAAHGTRFYPDIAGVARSHNYYPVPPLSAEDGIAAVALGFGETVVDGETCLRFCPRQPQHIVTLSTVSDIVRSSQRSFHALALRDPGRPGEDASGLRSFGLDAAEQDGTLAPLGSTWSPENDAVYDGIGRQGVRLVTFAGVLKHGAFPLAEALDVLLQLGVEGMGGPVEIEFAASLSTPPGTARELGFLQLRPLAQSRELEDLELAEVDPRRILCRSSSVLGHGRLELRDVVLVDGERFERGRSADVAADLARCNAELVARATPYLLIGVGRLGSRDPYLGIPVSWDQIAGARVIVEAGLRDVRVVPSQGSHFFQNLTAASVGYFTVNAEMGEGSIDWAWLASQPAESGSGSGPVRRLHLDRPLTVIMNGRRSEGLILKPERA